jgi:hypothetical protein
LTVVIIIFAIRTCSVGKCQDGLTFVHNIWCVVSIWS